MQKTRRTKFLATAIIFALVLNFVNFIPTARAAGVTNVSDVVSSMKAGVASSHVIKFTTPTGVGVGQTVTVTFDASYVMTGVVTSDVVATATAGTLTTTSVTGSVVTLTGATAVTAGATVTVTLNGAHKITNGVAGNNRVISIAGTFGDTGSLAIAILADDQISVSGTIAPTLSFAMGTVTPDNSIGFGTMSSSSVTYATDNLVGTTTATDTGAYGVATANSVRLAASTNGNGGLSISLRDQGNGVAGGLYNSGAAKNITAVAPNITLAAGTEGYQIFGVQAGQTAGAAFTMSSGFVKTTGNTAVSPTPAVFASCAGPVSAAIADVVVASAITAMTPAGAYVDTLTFTATANF